MKKIIIFLLIYNSLFSSKYFPDLLLYESNEQIKFELQNETKKNKQKVNTNWGGNTLSQETRTIDGIEQTLYSLSGGAWIEHKKVKLTANKIEIIGQDAYKGFLKGQTRVEDFENGIQITSSEGIYDKLSETIQLNGRTKFYYKDKKNLTTKISCPKLIRNLSENITYFNEGVIIENMDFTIYSNKAKFIEKEKYLELYEKPFIFTKDSFITGEKANHRLSEKTTEVEGQAIIIRQSFERKKDSEEKEKVITYLTGDKIISVDSEYPNTGIYGNAKLFRKNIEFSSTYIKSFGKSAQKIEAKETVEIFDKDNHTKLSGETLEYIKEKNYTHLTDNSKMEFLSKDNEEIQSTLTAVEIERFGNLKELVARGNVEINSDKAVLNGEYATYYEESEKMILEGNPSISRENKRIYCGKIILFPKKNKILMTDGLNVSKKNER